MTNYTVSEQAMADAVHTWIEGFGPNTYDIYSSVVFTCRDGHQHEIDKVFVKAGGIITAFELKDYMSKELWLQCKHRKAYANQVVGGIPRPTDRQRETGHFEMRFKQFKRAGFGLVYVDPDGKVEQILKPVTNEYVDTSILQRALCPGQQTEAQKAHAGAPNGAAPGRRWTNSDERFRPMLEYVRTCHGHGEHEPDTKEVVRMVGHAELGYDSRREAAREINRLGRDGKLNGLTQSDQQRLGGWKPS